MNIWWKTGVTTILYGDKLPPSCTMVVVLQVYVFMNI